MDVDDYGSHQVTRSKEKEQSPNQETGNAMVDRNHGIKLHKEPAHLLQSLLI